MTQKIITFASIIFFINGLIGQSVINTKVYGQKILNDQFKPKDNQETFQTIDSLLCKNKSDRKFYFRVANKVQQLSDGALSEYLSIVFKKYYFNHTSEFIENSKSLSQSDLYQWLNLIAFELYTEQGQYKNELSAIQSKLKNLENKQDKYLLQKYNTYISKKIIQLINSD